MVYKRVEERWVEAARTYRRNRRFSTDMDLRMAKLPGMWKIEITHREERKGGVKYPRQRKGKGKKTQRKCNADACHSGISIS